METDGIILEVTAEESAECAGLGFCLGRLSYRISPTGILLRSTSLGDVTGGVMVVLGEVPAEADAAALAAAIFTECKRRAYQSIYLNCGRPTAQAMQLASLLCETGLQLYVPEGIDCGTPVLDSAVTGGSFSLYIEEAAARHENGIALELLPLALEYTLPADGRGRLLSREELFDLQNCGYLHYYSGDLCARYVTWRGEDGLACFVLYDDADSLREKCRIARAAGVQTIFLPYGFLREELADFLEI